MREAGVDGSAIGVFSHYYRLLESGETGLIREESIEPLLDPPMLEALLRDLTEAEVEALRRRLGHHLESP